MHDFRSGGRGEGFSKEIYFWVSLILLHCVCLPFGFSILPSGLLSISSVFNLLRLQSVSESHEIQLADAAFRLKYSIVPKNVRKMKEHSIKMTPPT